MTISAFASRAARLAFLLPATLCLATSVHATRYYVKHAGTGLGTTWADAANLDTALNLANADTSTTDDEIWVAANLSHFVPLSTTDGFLITDVVKIYGGFRGNETQFSDRERLFSQTILDGQGVGRVISASGVAGATATEPGVIIDGFYIRGGSPSSTGSPDGGGIYSTKSDLRVGNCFIKENGARKGGGIFFQGDPDTGSSNLLQIKTTAITDNLAFLYGGGLYAETVYGDVVNTSFLENQAVTIDPVLIGQGGGVYLTAMASTNSLDFMNGVFWSNTAAIEGGGMLLGDGLLAGIGRAKLVNCTFNSNATGGTGGAIRTISSALQAEVYSSVLYGNFPGEAAGFPTAYDIRWSDVRGGFSGTGNINSLPQYQNSSQGRLRLTYVMGTASPCIDAARDCFVPPDNLDVDEDGNTGEIVDKDADGAARFVDDAAGNTGDGSCLTIDYLDMGAYEFH